MSNWFDESPTNFAGQPSNCRPAARPWPPPNRSPSASRVGHRPAGQDIISDAEPLIFDAFALLAVSIFVPGTQKSPTKHWNAHATYYYSLPLTGDPADRQTGTFFPGKH